MIGPVEDQLHHSVPVSDVADRYHTLKEINDTIHNFIWGGKTAKIAQNTLVKNIGEGGVKRCHYPTKVDELKLSYIKILCSNR